jgi:hypothetical protein
MRNINRLQVPATGRHNEQMQPDHHFDLRHSDRDERKSATARPRVSSLDIRDPIQALTSLLFTPCPPISPLKAI